MPRVTWVTVATDNPMGQQHYEHEIQRALLRKSDENWQFRDVRVSSLRSAMTGVRRSPSGLLRDASLPIALALGALTYRTRGLVHRFDLRLPPAPGPEIVTAHDLPPARFHDEGHLPSSIAAGARRALRVIVPSSFAAAELEELLGVTRSVVIPLGLSEAFQAPAPASDESLHARGLHDRFVVHAAGASSRKNLPALAHAWRGVHQEQPDLQLVLCGPPDERRQAAFDQVPGVVMAGRLTAPDVAGLMCRAAAVVVPSLYEGFGLPALEGMACGAPVVATRAGALPEVCGDGALLVGTSADEIGHGLLTVLGDDLLAASLAERGRARALTFSWDEAAARHLDVYRSVLA